MRDEYDSSHGERGKFYHAGARLNIPVYLDDEVLAFVDKIADRKRLEHSEVVNELLRADIKLFETLE